MSPLADKTDGNKVYVFSPLPLHALNNYKAHRHDDIDFTAKSTDEMQTSSTLAEIINIAYT